MPASQEINIKERVVSGQNDIQNQGYNQTPGDSHKSLPQISENNGAFTDSAKEMITTQDRGVLYVGFYMGVFLLLVYLVIRCACFLCSTYNSEKNKLTWDVLTMTQLLPEDIVTGKLLGVLFIPLVQLTIGFLAIFFWVFKGIVSLEGAFSIYYL